MVKRCIYFVTKNGIRKITTDIPWDLDSNELNIQVYAKRLYEKTLPKLSPCVEVSTAALDYSWRSYATPFVKDANGVSISRMWKSMDDMEIKQGSRFKPGIYESIYLHCLSEDQILNAFNIKCFSDIYHNPDKSTHTNALALCALQLLQKQDKLEYLNDLEKFSYWYQFNIAPVEYIADIDVI